MTHAEDDVANVDSVECEALEHGSGQYHERAAPVRRGRAARRHRRPATSSSRSACSYATEIVVGIPTKDGRVVSAMDHKPFLLRRVVGSSQHGSPVERQLQASAVLRRSCPDACSFVGDEAVVADLALGPAVPIGTEGFRPQASCTTDRSWSSTGLPPVRTWRANAKNDDWTGAGPNSDGYRRAVPRPAGEGFRSSPYAGSPAADRSSPVRLATELKHPN